MFALFKFTNLMKQVLINVPIAKVNGNTFKGKLTVLKGNIINTSVYIIWTIVVLLGDIFLIFLAKVDVMVNSCTKNLNLKTGLISKCIIEAAGTEIQNEVAFLYPQGIDYGGIAITSRGRIKSIKKIYHSACPHFDNSYNNVI